LFNETKSGEAFYKRLRKLRERNSRSHELADVLEIFCLCLLLGFEGDETEDRRVWIRELVIEIAATRGKLPTLSAGASNLLESIPQHYDKPTRWLHHIGWAAVALVVICYLVAQWQVSGGASEISRLLQTGAIR
jgi:type VI protein secretion system component VasF